MHLPDDRPRLEVRVEVTPDELLATMTVERVPGARYRLEDQPPNTSVTLRRLVAERIPCPEPSLDDLYGALADHGVVWGVLEDAVERLLHGGVNEPVARGVAAACAPRTRPCSCTRSTRAAPSASCAQVPCSRASRPRARASTA